MDDFNTEKIKWEIKVPLFKNTVILKDLGLALGIPFGILIIVLLIVSKGDISRDGIGYPLIFIGIFFVMSFMFIILIYGGKYDAGYVIDSKGILNYTQEKQAKKNKIINVLLVIIGILSGKPSAAGGGILAQSRQYVLVKWKSIKKVKVYPKSKSIVIRGGFAEKIALFCNDDNFELVRDIILDKVKMNGD
ncbi:MAG: hypothetical protein PHC44_03455 [Lutispora sp.]|nr:hypothetical protein [Lutispora sp.]MDD4833772.1 hypothetical protein [Lutispora sp.]